MNAWWPHLDTSAGMESGKQDQDMEQNRAGCPP